MTLVPGVESKARKSKGGADVYNVTDVNGNGYIIGKKGNADWGDHTALIYYSFMPSLYGDHWGTPGGSPIEEDDCIILIDAYNKSPEVLQPELVAWLEAQGFTIPIE